LHRPTSFAGPHAAPPAFGAATTDRDLVRWPFLPHDTPHAVHSSQSDILQSSEHGWVLHTRSSSLGHALPPNFACTRTSDFRDWVPTPQDLEHFDQGSHVWTQFTGQGAVLQLRLAASAPQATPPCFGCTTTERDRTAIPPPHSELHAVHAVHPDSLQWTGHSVTLHGRLSWRAPHALPPCFGCVFTRRVRSWTPLPQVVEQAVHGNQS
jgi:hypothetical protein